MTPEQEKSVLDLQAKLSTFDPSQVAWKSDLTNLVNKSELPKQPDLSNLASKADLADLAKKSDIPVIPVIPAIPATPDLTNLASKNELASLAAELKATVEELKIVRADLDTLRNVHTTSGISVASVVQALDAAASVTHGPPVQVEYFRNVLKIASKVQ